MNNIYGNYVAHAVASTSESGPWHIQGPSEKSALCGKTLRGDLRRMDLHVSLLECIDCMLIGAKHVR